MSINCKVCGAPIYQGVLCATCWAEQAHPEPSLVKPDGMARESQHEVDQLRTALAYRDVLVVAKDEALKGILIKAEEQIVGIEQMAKNALALTPDSLANCAVMPKEELAELRRDRERLASILHKLEPVAQTYEKLLREGFIAPDAPPIAKLCASVCAAVRAAAARQHGERGTK